MSESFKDYLTDLVGNKLKLKINDNRSTMLSVKWEPDCTKVSMHRIFLDAPRNIMDELACYLAREKRSIPKIVRHYIEESLKKLDYSNSIDKSKLTTLGKVYDLETLYNQVNEEYFNNELDLLITWFGRKQQKPSRSKSRVTLGLYHDQLKLIKINRFLDAPTIPEFLISYVIYHEMLHNVCPSYVDNKGVHRVHTKEFKEREEQFRYFNEAQKWIEDNPTELFA